MKMSGMLCMWPASMRGLLEVSSELNGRIEIFCCDLFCASINRVGDDVAKNVEYLSSEGYLTVTAPNFTKSPTQSNLKEKLVKLSVLTVEHGFTS